MEKRTVEILEVIESGPCPKCGGHGWTVDGDPRTGKYWLLCLATEDPHCVETKPLPDDIVVKHAHED